MIGTAGESKGHMGTYSPGCPPEGQVGVRFYVQIGQGCFHTERGKE